MYLADMLLGFSRQRYGGWWERSCAAWHYRSLTIETFRVTAYILLFNFTGEGVMRHEKSLGRYCRWIFTGKREACIPLERPTLYPLSHSSTPSGQEANGTVVDVVVWPVCKLLPRATLATLVTLLFVMNGFTRPQIMPVFIFRTAASRYSV